MTSETSDNPWVAPQFIDNQRRVSDTELLCFKGQHIAWSWDGSSILAADPDRRGLVDKLRAARIDPLRVVYDFVEDPEVSYLV